MGGVLSLRRERVGALDALADLVRSRESELLQVLTAVEDHRTARDEIDKSSRALASYSKELPLLENRAPDGDVAVALPFNNPLYSLILYTCGAALSGGNVYVRPSTITAAQVTSIVEILGSGLQSVGIYLVDIPGREFLRYASTQTGIGTLIFTGAWGNLVRLQGDFPGHKRLIYCGSGINPFIVGHDVNDFGGVGAAVRLAVASRLYNSGQDCLCAERFYVHETQLDGFCNALENELSNVRVGQFGDPDADVVPLLGGMDTRLDRLAADAEGEWLVPYESSEGLVKPSVLLTESDTPIMLEEKFGPVFTIAPYSDDDVITHALDFTHRFGATVVGAYDAAVLSTYPHVSRANSIISIEAEDCHVPFGGRRRSGFVKSRHGIFDGPILYSVATTVDVTTGK